jgi:hypothetical protein
LIDGFGDARHAPFARGDACGANQGKNQKKGAHITKDFDCHGAQ